MAALVQTTFSQLISLYKNVCASSQIVSLKYVPNDPINDMLTLVQIVAWRLFDAKSFSEAMME